MAEDNNPEKLDFVPFNSEEVKKPVLAYPVISESKEARTFKVIQGSDQAALSQSSRRILSILATVLIIIFIIGCGLVFLTIRNFT